MNSGLVGALGAAPLQTVKSRLGSFQGRSHTQLSLATNGALILGEAPDGTVIGGNARGARAVDLQIVKYVANEVASGPDSAILASIASRASASKSIVVCGEQTISSGGGSFAGGYGSVASGSHSFAFGQQSTASGPYSTALGTGAVADRWGMLAFSSGRFGFAGSGQNCFFTLLGTTTNNTPTIILVGGVNYLTIPSGKVMSGIVNICGIKSDVSVVARYCRQFTIKNVAGTTSLVGSVVTVGSDEANGTSVSITADDTNDAFKLEVTGIASESWRWVVTINAIEVAYGY